MKRLAIPFVLASGCAWSTFDDLSKTTPAQAIEKPDGIKSTDFGVAVVGVTVGQSGGRFAVLSSGSGNYSTFDVAADGSSAIGDNENLGIHTIDSLTGNALLITDGTGQVAIVDNSNVGTVVAVHGPGTGLNVDQQVGSSLHPTGATFAGGRIIVVVDPAGTPGVANAFAVSATGGVTSCILNDNTMPTSVEISPVAIAADATAGLAYVWDKTSGKLFSYSFTAFDGCPASNPMPGSALTGGFAGMAPAPMNGGHVDLSGAFAVLTGYDSASTMTGQVTVVNRTTGGQQVGTPLIAHGVRSATVDTFGTQPALVLGYPNRATGSTANAGAVDIHPIDVAGNVAGTPSESIELPNTAQNHAFGRSVTTMKHNNTTVIIVSASNTVYAYFKTSLYADTRTP